MDKINDYPRNNIISVRVSDEQLLFLKHLKGEREATVSDLIREALSTLEVSRNRNLENSVTE